ncbi:FkbM family methyltransferase [Roseibium sp. HPY-6]|uniref:FkbM family methyltransferase n=1 Tax=Roseibium sp. HPY-6 TaxID=3229852 RepID=UPI00338DD64B
MGRMLKPAKSKTKKRPISDLVKRAKHQIKVLRGQKHSLQFRFSSSDHPLSSLGTEYGGWTFVDDNDLNGSVIISAGLGEDASFDVAFANRYGAKVIIVDPTPRAVVHFEQISERFGLPSSQSFNSTGQQDPAAYELSAIDASRLILVKKALWNAVTSVRFYEPKDKKNVSHSISNFQNEYSKETDYIDVPAIDMISLLDEMGVDRSQVKLVKLDIEGAEIEVIRHMLANDFFPKQILLEIDELNFPSKVAYGRATEVSTLLKKRGYKVVWSDGRANFLFYRKQ